MTVLPEIAGRFSQLCEWRHAFHRHPEIGMDVPRTAGTVAAMLRDMGVDEVVEGVGGLGVVGIIDRGAGHTTGLRADMDALPVTETTGLPYASEIAGSMHACGHDGHTTMLLGAAQYLAADSDFCGRAVLVFQPAEETLEGAQAMLADGLMARFGIDTVFGLHNLPGSEPAGSIRVPTGPVMASSNRFTILVRGQGGHAALPELSRNPLTACAEVISALGGVAGMVAEGSESAERIVLTVTNVGGGTGTYNIIPDDATLQGSVRYLAPQHGDLIPRCIDEVVAPIAAAHDVSVVVDFEHLCPVVMNAPAQAELARAAASDIVGPDGTSEGGPLMASEDFAFFLQARPGAYGFITNGPGLPWHNPGYRFNDDILPVGASYLARLVERAGE
jgi:hippurate hydrolase